MIIKRQKLFLVFLIILQILFVKVAISQSDSAYVVSGKINGLNNDIWVWLQNNEDNQQSIDSIKTKNGEFGFIGTLAKPSLHLLKIGKSSKESFPFFIENTKIDINCDYKFPFGCEVKGSYNQHLIDEFAIREKLAWNQEVIESLKNTYINYSEKAGFIRKQRFSDTIK